MQPGATLGQALLCLFNSLLGSEVLPKTIEAKSRSVARRWRACADKFLWWCRTSSGRPRRPCSRKLWVREFARRRTSVWVRRRPRIGRSVWRNRAVCLRRPYHRAVLLGFAPGARPSGIARRRRVKLDHLGERQIDQHIGVDHHKSSIFQMALPSEDRRRYREVRFLSSS